MATWGVTKFLHKAPSYGNLDQYSKKELVHAGELVSHASNLWPKPAEEWITRVQAMMTKMSLVRIASAHCAQHLVFIEKQAR